MTTLSLPASTTRSALACCVVVTGTVLGLSGIDLLLPAVPSLPALLGGTPAQAQFVMAAYVAGVVMGLLLFGYLSSALDRRWLFVGSLGAFGLLSLACAAAPGMAALIALRFLQGAVSCGAAVLAPGLIRELFSEIGAVRAIGVVGSIESLVPGLAPIAGAWLFAQFGWTASFWVTGGLALLTGLVVLLQPDLLPRGRAVVSSERGSYLSLFGNGAYLRYALTHALVLGGLLAFVLSVPTIVVSGMGGTVESFILMQVLGVGSFILFANLSGSAVSRFGIERVITFGTALAAGGTLLILAYALLLGDRASPWALGPLAVPWGVGLGLRGGPGCMRALAASGDDGRGAALLMVATMGVAAGGTALAAPFVTSGLLPVALVVAGMVVPAVVLLWALPSLDRRS